MYISYIIGELKGNKEELHKFTYHLKEVVAIFKILLQGENAKITKTFPALGSLHPGWEHVTGKHYIKCDKCKYY